MPAARGSDTFSVQATVATPYLGCSGASQDTAASAVVSHSTNKYGLNPLVQSALGLAMISAQIISAQSCRQEMERKQTLAADRADPGSHRAHGLENVLANWEAGYVHQRQPADTAIGRERYGKPT